LLKKNKKIKKLTLNLPLAHFILFLI